MIRKQRVKVVVIGSFFYLVKRDSLSRFIIVEVHRYELLLHKVLLTPMTIGECGCAECVSLGADLIDEILQFSAGTDLDGALANSCTNVFDDS